MAISNCLFSPTSENPRGFSVWCVLAKLSANPPACRQAGATRLTRRVVVCHMKNNLGNEELNNYINSIYSFELSK